MRTGFVFKDRHSEEFGALVRTQSRPITPEMKTQVYDAPYMDGGYDFSAVNIYGREFYKKRVFKVNITVSEDSLDALQARLAELSAWLFGGGELRFDDTPEVIWDARVEDLTDYRPEHGSMAALTVSFGVSAFSRLEFDVREGPVLGSSIRLGSDIPLDLGSMFVFKGKSFTAVNIGDVPARPVITIDGAAVISCGGATLETPSACVIDCGRHTVTDNEGRSLMGDVKGGFFELMPGENTVTLSEERGISVNYTPKYIWNYH